MSGVGLFNRALSIEAAEKALAEAEATLARWSAESEAKAAELSHLQAHAGDDVLADADAAGRIATDMQRLGAEQDVARRAVLAATPRGSRRRGGRWWGRGRRSCGRGRVVRGGGAADARAARS